MKKLILFLMILSSSVYSLPVDEKLTFRILKVSKTKKTLLVNRGIEDGLQQGDHAKVFITKGVIARALCVKVSPTRSVWSIYRLVNADYLVPDTVLNLKITEPVKITNDESKQLAKDDTPTMIGLEDPNKLGIPLAPGANDIGMFNAGGANVNELKALAGSNVTNIRDKNIELFLGMNFSGLGSTTQGLSGQGISASDATTIMGGFNFKFGLEYYFKEEKDWYHRFSFKAYTRVQKQTITMGSNETSSSGMTAFGTGVNWHPFTQGSSVNQFIPFASVDVEFGVREDTIQGGSEVNISVISQKASLMNVIFGGGFKYFTGEGYGARAALDYYLETASYTGDAVLQTPWTKSTSGPRLWFELSYRL
jgi:hypothetical protein